MAKLAFKCVYNVFASANGKPTVEEVYEKPEGQGDEVETHIVSGKVTMKNGQPMKNTYISFDNWENEYEGITDEEGNYVISVPNGEYDIYIAYYGYLEDVVVVSADMEENVTLDIPLGSNFYQISGKVVAKNGELIANTEIAFMVTDDTGDLRGFSIRTDENGEFEERMLEGTYTGRDSFVEGISFTLDDKTDVSKPLVITLTKDVYQVKGKVTLGDMTAGKNEHSFFTLYFQNKETGTSEHANLNDDKAYSIILSEGNYDVTGTNWIISDAGEEREDYFYFGQIEVKEKMTWDLSMEMLHEVTVETSGLEGVADVDSLRVDEVYLSPYGKGNAYIGNETGTIEGMFYDRDEEGNAYGIYTFDTTFDFRDVEVGEKAVISDGIARLDQVAELDATYSGKMMVDEVENEGELYILASGTEYFSFTPEESGTYQFCNQVASSQTRDSVEVGVSVYDSRFEYMDADYVNDSSMEYNVELEAGKRYFIIASAVELNVTESKTFAFTIKKVETQKN